MSATVAELPALKDCVTRLLSNLAALTAPDSYGCPLCGKAACKHHAAAAAAYERLERAAGMAARAETKNDVDAALVYAYGNGES
jgi:hypothetical protein